MSRRWPIIFIVCLLLILLLAILLILLRLVGYGPGLPISFFPAPFQIKGYAMVPCDASDLCGTSTFSSFSAAQSSNICITWTEVARGSQDQLQIYIYDNKKNRVFPTEPENAQNNLLPIVGENRSCRVLQVVPPLPPGTYRTEFVIEGSPSGDYINWKITQPFNPETKLTLTKKAFPTTYMRVGDNIRYDYVIKNTGNTIWQGSMTVADDHQSEVNCQTVHNVGNRDGAFDPNEAVTCYATYVITQADIDVGSVTSTARLEGAEPVTTTITSGCHPPEGWVIYDVRGTDTLDEISTWYSDLTVAKLLQVNCLNTSTIFAGQKIYVPGSPLPAKIRGIVFMDPNHNDIQDRNELGLSGAPVKITDSNGAVVATTTTGANGVFEIDLPPGTYFVFQFQVILLPGEVKNQKFAVVPVP